MKGGTVKSNKGKQSMGHVGQSRSFGNQSNGGGSGWQNMGKKSVVSQLKHIEKKAQHEERAE